MLDGIDFVVKHGTVFALLGPNGAGKTTTVHILGTLLLPDCRKARFAAVSVSFSSSPECLSIIVPISFN